MCCLEIPRRCSTTCQLMVSCLQKHPQKNKAVTQLYQHKPSPLVFFVFVTFMSTYRKRHTSDNTGSQHSQVVSA